MAFSTDLSGWEAFASAERERGARDDEAVMGAIYRALKTGNGVDKASAQLHAAKTEAEQRLVRETILWPVMDKVGAQYREIVAGLGLEEIPRLETSNWDPDYSVSKSDMDRDSWLEIFQENEDAKARAERFKKGMTIVPESDVQSGNRELEGTVANLEAWSQTFGVDSTGTSISEAGVGTKVKNWLKRLFQ